jgi:hypothetical protein
MFFSLPGINAKVHPVKYYHVSNFTVQAFQRVIR